MKSGELLQIQHLVFTDSPTPNLLWEGSLAPQAWPPHLKLWAPTRVAAASTSLVDRVTTPWKFPGWLIVKYVFDHCVIARLERQTTSADMLRS